MPTIRHHDPDVMVMAESRTGVRQHRPSQIVDYGGPNLEILSDFLSLLERVIQESSWSVEVDLSDAVCWPGCEPYSCDRGLSPRRRQRHHLPSRKMIGPDDMTRLRTRLWRSASIRDTCGLEQRREASF
uniref:hypothetical protein n=1 Tax=Rhodococcus sp. NS1 TaxID=402236 RepID=UPI001563A7C5|nr:hypothetical protein [Rhodococcus sp. NS1]